MNSGQSDLQHPAIVVTGDIIREIRLYTGSRYFASDPTGSGFITEEKFGGAVLLRELLEAAQPGVSRLGLQIDEAREWPGQLKTLAQYAPFEEGFRGDPTPAAGTKPNRVWRVKESPGYGATFAVPPCEPPVTSVDSDLARARVLIVDDGGAGFRTQRAAGRWPYGGDWSGPLPQWVVLKMAQPLCRGDLWQQLSERCDWRSGESVSQLMVIVSADELRRDGAAINRGLSWERTIWDTCQSLTRNPRFAELQRAAHVLVVYRREGVLWLRPATSDRSRSAESQDHPQAVLVYDPGMAEGQWKTTLRDHDGDVYGNLSVVTAAISLELARCKSSADLAESDFTSAIGRGLTAARQLRLLGHGRVGKSLKPGFPCSEIGAILRSTNRDEPKRALHQPPDRYESVRLPTSAGASSLCDALPFDWTIASLNDEAGDPPVMFAHAFQTAIYGTSRLRDVPHAKFGDLLSVDRTEIETLRSLRQMVHAYHQGGTQKQPLCIGAFGPPGAGKSFGIKQIAYEILGKDVPFLEFNLSQFSDPNDLIGAFHQVRDRVLSGRTPVVFWDEFDSQNLKWLQYLLAPMQDGKFQSGQLTHTIGKCIFVFAGATSWDFEHFGPAPEPASRAEADELRKLTAENPDFARVRREGQAEFRLKKGPDFLSRLSGHINVDGPNQRLKYSFSTGQWDQADAADVTFPVRRALLLRSFLRAKDDETLDIDRDLLNALLRQPRYRHGARSMEKTVEPLRVRHAPLRPAQLPSPQVLAQHLDPPETFPALLSENTGFLTDANVRSLAAAIQENYRRLYAQPDQYVADPQFREVFEALDAAGKATNLAAARGIPHVLAVAGLCIAAGHASPHEEAAAAKRIEEFLHALRREEHARWMNYMSSSGWLQSVQKNASGEFIRDKKALLHTCLLPFDELPEPQQQKDDEAIRSLPQTVKMVGFKIVLFPQ